MYSREHASTYNTALAAAKAEQWQEAAELLEALVAEQPADALALSLLGKVYFHRDDRDKAADCWHQALQHDPNHSAARACLDALNRRVVPTQVTRGLGWAFLLLVFIAQLVVLWYLHDIHRGLTPFTENSNSVEIGEAQRSSLPDTQTSPEEPAGHGPEQSQPAGSEPTPNVDGVFPATRVMVPQISAEELYGQALDDYRQGAFDKAEVKFRHSISASDLPADLADNVLYWLAACALAQGRKTEASEFLGRLLKEHPSTNKREDAQRLLARTRTP